MPTTYRLRLSIAMLSTTECERALEAIRLQWQSPSFIQRQFCGELVALLSLQHEAAIDTGESPDWFIERIAAAIWHGIGRFTRLSFDLAPHEAPDGKLYVLDESHYRTVMQKFRLGSPTLRH
ncbi:hypothetical protein [Chitinilyticum piscinae]|uniref:Uncharacterized protein n=1 Tax=Chitinilyticum piscinae TaxID=2866724 RepID=A0A8J7K819_9NEIS|nr:hypothetical protein [Chitinilyticum piscinae]MBE9608923.1 hypothetical protein [Chitinilyticum piscinae]